MTDKKAIIIKEIEIGHLELKYGHTRIQDNKAVIRLSKSIDRFGQITPVIVIPIQNPGHILIDGYLRVKAMKQLRKDTVFAQIYQCSEQEALINVLVRTQDRKWDLFEQAELIRELAENHGLSTAKIAALLGKNKSFVTRRISLLQVLDENTHNHVRKGHISIWSACRVLVPMARANPDHARTLTDNLVRNDVSTRDLATLFKHYKESNKKVRDEMVNNPHLFLKALELREQEKQARSINGGPEEKWLKDIKIVGHMLRRLKKETAVVFYENQNDVERRRLLKAFDETKKTFLSLDQAIMRPDDSPGNSPNHSDVVCQRSRHSTNQSYGKAFKEDCAQGNTQGLQATFLKTKVSSGSFADSRRAVPIVQGECGSSVGESPGRI